MNAAQMDKHPVCYSSTIDISLKFSSGLKHKAQQQLFHSSRQPMGICPWTTGFTYGHRKLLVPKLGQISNRPWLL